MSILSLSSDPVMPCAVCVRVCACARPPACLSYGNDKLAIMPG